MLCEKELPVQFSTPKYLESDLEIAIRTDQDEELFFMLKQFTMDDEIYGKLLKWAIQNSSYNVLRRLKKWSTIASIDYETTKKLFHEPSHLGLCWFLDDWKIAPIKNLTSSRLMSILEEQNRFRDIFEIYRACFYEFDRKEQIRIGTFLLEAAVSGRSKSKDGLFMMYCVAYSISDSCLVLSNLLPIVSRDAMSLSQTDISLGLKFICDSCRVCKHDHTWDIVRSAIKIGNTYLVDAIVSKAPSSSFIDIPYGMIAVTLNLSSKRKAFKKILDKHPKFSSSSLWKAVYTSGTLLRLLPFRFDHFSENKIR